jgi:hypothetical protein
LTHEKFTPSGRFIPEPFETDRGEERKEAAKENSLGNLYHGCGVLRQTLKDVNQGNQSRLDSGAQEMLSV